MSDACNCTCGHNINHCQYPACVTGERDKAIIERGKSALDTQVGGTHYRQGTIQPVQYIEANKLLFLEASVVKRVTRHDKEGGKGRQDIEKAIHELQLLLELRYAEDKGH